MRAQEDVVSDVSWRDVVVTELISAFGTVLVHEWTEGVIPRCVCCTDEYGGS